MANNDLILQIQNLSIALHTEQGYGFAVNELSFYVPEGKTVALLGESGCGKTMTALAINQLLPSSTAYSKESKIIFQQQDLLQLSEKQMQAIRGRDIGMIFQEPMTSLNPVLTIGEQIAEVFKQHSNLGKAGIKAAVIELLYQTGIPAPEQRYHDYPHQLSGGMKQRVMIAISLAAQPRLLIADEPTTALDVTIQAQILQLMRDMQAKYNMAILLISHDLGVVAEMADYVAVMYAGKIIEFAAVDLFFKEPKHPYSQKLFSAMPSQDKRRQQLEVIPGCVPNLLKQPQACGFAERCHYAWDACTSTAPNYINTAVQEHRVRCHLYEPSVVHSREGGVVGSNESNHREISRCARNDSSILECDTRNDRNLLEGNIENNSSELAEYLTQSCHPKQREGSPDDLTTVNAAPLLTVQGLKTYFPIRKGILQRTVAHVKAVDGIDIDLQQGQTLAIVGESGCGKSTLGRSLLHLIKPHEGSICYKDNCLSSLTKQEMNSLRNDIQMIFQDPFSSLNPRMLVMDIIAEGLRAQKLITSRPDRLNRIDELLTQVGLPLESKYRYPHEFSGGQRQRICIARALAVQPQLIVCDEPTSALDLSVQAQILNLLKSLQNEHGLTYIFITHDISVVSYMADTVAVMYLGRIVEQGSVAKVLTQPQHPYTQALLAAVPDKIPGKDKAHENVLGEQPSPLNPPVGCHFHPRCPHAMSQCKQQYPTSHYDTDGHMTKCYLYEAS